ncbi:MAG: hypothetical protein JWN20_2166 [Jatrophihabitantaceae bacterium]|nr:hypothetical protein [Jatrophihabitantaceae bacterium]
MGMDEYLVARIEMLERHIDWLYNRSGFAGPYGTAPVGSPAQHIPAGPGPAGAGAATAGPSAPSPQLMEYVDRGETINAIKQYRAETGAGLKEAKDYVDGLSPRR